MNISAAPRSLLIAALALALSACQVSVPPITPAAAVTQQPTQAPSTATTTPTETATRPPTNVPTPMPASDPRALTPENIGEARLLQVLGVKAGTQGKATRLARSAYGDLAMIRSNEVVILHPSRLTEAASLPRTGVRDVVYGDSGRLYLLRRQALEIWDPSPNGSTRVIALKEHSPDWRLTVDAGEQTAVLVGDEGGQVIDLATGQQRYTVQGIAPEGDPGLYSVVFSPDGRQFTASCFSGLHTWDLRTSQLMQRTGPVGVSELAQAGDWLAAGGESEVANLLPRAGGVHYPLAGPRSGWVRALDLTLNGKWLATGWDDGWVRVFDTTTREIILEFDPLKRRAAGEPSTEAGDPALAEDPAAAGFPGAAANTAVRDLVFLGDFHLAVLSADGTLSLWSWSREITQASLKREAENTESSAPAAPPFDHLATDPSGRWLAAETNGQVYLWDLPAGKQAATWPTGQMNIFGLAFSPDGQRLAVGAQALNPTGGVTIWDVPAGKQVQSLADGGKVAFTNQPGLLAVGGAGDPDGVRFWDINTGQNTGIILPEARLLDFRLRAEANLLLTLDADGTIRQWDLTANRSDLYSGPDPFQALAFSQSGWLAGGGERAIWLWTLRGAGEPPNQLTGSSGWVRALDFAPGGRLLASAGDDGVVRLWDTQNHRLVRALDPLDSAVRQVLFVDQGRRLALIGQDGLVYIWGVQ